MDPGSASSSPPQAKESQFTRGALSVLRIAAKHGAESLELPFCVRLLADPMSSAMEANRANLDVYIGIGQNVVPPPGIAILATIG